jgi:hypothetical protein
MRNHRTLEVEEFKRWNYRQKNHKTSKVGVRKKKNHKKLRNKDKWRLFQR